jgi:glycosyltransferase involved in cell wall biosynthesis
MEALLMEKPVIATNLGGIHEYLTDKKDALLVDYTMVPVDNKGYNGQWYTPDQKWAEVDIDHLRKNMRWVFEHQDKAAKMGKAGRKTVVDKFSFIVVGAVMLHRLKEITEKIQAL